MRRGVNRAADREGDLPVASTSESQLGVPSRISRGGSRNSPRGRPIRGGARRHRPSTTSGVAMHRLLVLLSGISLCLTGCGTVTSSGGGADADPGSTVDAGAPDGGLVDAAP